MKSLIRSFHSKHFTVNSLRNIVKTESHGREFLKQAFDIAHINTNDFKIFSKQELAKFLDDVSHHEDWGDNDLDGFLILKDKLIELTNEARGNEIYLISKDWFN